jgi:CHAT domain-containing protein/Flp pilus assembly protein TadD
MPFKNRRSVEGILRLGCIALMLLRLSSLMVERLASAAAEDQPKNSASKSVFIQLTAGASTVHELARGDEQLFEVSLGQGQLFRFSINKGDLGLSLILYGPSGEKLFQQVGHRYEVMDFSVPTDEAGMYRLEIGSLEQDEARGHYELKVEPIRTATPQDRKDYAARQAIAMASLLMSNWTEASLRQAIEKYDEAALVWLSSHNPGSAADALMRAGKVCFVLGEYREAVKRYQKAAAEARNAGVRVLESEALSQVGRLYSYLGNNDEAQKQLVKARDFLAEYSRGNPAGTVRQAYAKALSNLAEVNYSKGDLVKSSENFKQALKLFSEIGDRDGEARVHLFIGYIAGSLGEPEKAVAEITQALNLYRAVANKSGQGLSLTALGLSHSLKRDEEHAIQMHLEAMNIFSTIGDRQSEAITFNALGQAYEFLGQYPTALDNYQKALRLFEENGGLDLAAVSMFKIARVYRMNGDLSQSLSYYQQCLKLSRAAKKSRTEANALNEVALIYASQGSREQTIAQYQKILKFYAAIADRRGQAGALNGLGDFLLRLGEKKEALEYYKKALPLSEQAGDKDVLISTLYNIARAERDLGALDDALSYIKRSIEIIEALRTNVASPDCRTSYFAVIRKHYDLDIDILMKLNSQLPEQGFAAAALLASENARARSLIDILIESQADIRQGAPPELLERERELQGLIRSQAQYQMDLSISGKDPTETSEVARQIDLLRTEYQEIEAQLRDQNPRVLTLMKSTPLTLEQIQTELADGNTILLEYALGDERSYLWAVTADSIQSYELPSRATLEDAGRELYKLITARQASGGKIDVAYQADVEASDRLYQEKALNLSRILLGQVAEQLGTRRLLVVTEGMLQYIPLDALPLPQAGTVGPDAAAQDLPPLISTHEIVMLPSISTLATIRREKRELGLRNKIVAVLADPVFSANDDRVQYGQPHSAIALARSDQSSSQPALRDLEGSLRNGGAVRLAHASEEADAILAATPRGSGLIAKGFDASRETAMSSAVGEYQIVHFATHGLLNSEHPELSGIVLTMVNHDGNETDGLMPLHDIYNLRLSAELIVLSACDTALGKDIKGEGLVGLTHGFMSAGSKSVVASLWKVDDRATAALMAEFYKSMLQDGLTPAAALRSAKQKIRQEKAWSAPYFWAGFVLQGEYRDRIAVDRKSWLRVGVAVSLALVLVSFGLIILHRRRRRLFVAPGI